MKKIKIIFLFGILVLTFSSCQKCTTCNDRWGDLEICEGDFNSNQEYQDAISEYEADGYSCH
jgi:hypothetical protein